MSSSSSLLPRPATARPSRARSGGDTSAGDRAQILTRSRMALAALLILAAAAYIWDLGASGSANSFYAAAVQAATNSWKAFFFGSLDSSSFITVDKPPASIWMMALSGRVFGFSSWSMLIPQALEGVAAVALLYGAVRRWFGDGAGLAAGAILACTPVAALMFRFNNPDALLVLLLVASAYCLTRSLERAGTRWVVAAGTMIGFAFLAKMMQAFLVVPAFGLVYLIAAPTGLRRRLAQLLAGTAAIVVSAGWWVAIIALWPAGSRPMIDGSSTNNIFNLILGYNGLGRIFGASGPGGGGAGGGANFSGSTSILRLFNDLMGGQASWLLPAALLALGVGLWSTRRAPRTDRARAALVLWGGWLIVSALVFSLSSGIIHTYYTVALAPAIAALVAIGGRMLWDRRGALAARAAAALALLGTAAWAWVLLDRTPGWEPWLRWLIVIAAAMAAAGIVAAGALRPLVARRLAPAVVALALVGGLAGPVAYAAQTVTTAHTGSVPSAGPGSAGDGRGGFGGAGHGLGSSRSGAGLPPGAIGRTEGSGTAAVSGATAGSGAPARSGASAGSGASAAFGPGGGTGERPSGATRAGGGGGQSSVSAALTRALETNAGRYRWVAATSGSQSAASLELATGGDPVMAIGGFSGEGGNLTLKQFQQYVDLGEIHYYIASGGGAGGGPGGGSSAITTWVAAHFKAVTIGGQTVYDLTRQSS